MYDIIYVRIFRIWREREEFLMKFKKLLSAVAATAMAASAFAGLAVTASAADVTHTITFNGENGGDTTYFTWNSAKHNFNTKFNGCTYGGVSYTSGLKMEGATSVSFTTTQNNATVTIVQSTWSDNTIKFDGTDLAVADASEITGGRVYSIDSVEAGPHSVTRGSGESGLFCISVTEPEDTATYDDATDVNLYLENVLVEEDSYDLTAGDTITFTAEVLPSTANQRVIWSSSDNDVATVSNGNVVAVSAGEAVITAKSNDGLAETSITLNVAAKPAIPCVEGTIDDLVAPTETTVFDFLTPAEDLNPANNDVVYFSGNLYFDKQAYISSSYGISIQTGSGTYDLNGTKTSNRLRIKNTQMYVTFKLPVGATIEVPVVAGSNDGREVVLVSGSEYVDENTYVAKTDGLGSGTQTIEYTNNGDAAELITLGATKDSYFAQVRITVPEEGTHAAVTDKIFDGVVSEEGATDAPVAVFAAEITPGTIAATGITWSVTAGEATTGTQTEAVNISGDAKVYIGFLVTLDSETAVAAKDDINADSLTITINE